MSASKSQPVKISENSYLISGKKPPVTLEDAYRTPKKFKT